MTKILVIDDDDAFRGSLIATLEKKGFEVVQAATGALGVQLARTHLPDLILCDVNMKGVSGNLTLYALRRDPQIAPIPFILMSGFLVGGDTPPGIERGADGFLVKPINTEKLLSTIQQYVTKSEAAPSEGRASSGEPAADGVPGATDLLQPLNRILEITRLLGASRQPMQPKEIADLAGQAYQAAAQLHRRIENCLLYAEVESLASDWQRQAALQQLRTGVRAVVEPVAREKAVSLKRAADLSFNFQDDGDAAISPGHLRKIVTELLDNAFRFSRPGTQVLLQTAKDGEHLALSVVDLGSGMTPEQIAEAGNPIPLDQALLVRHGSGLSLTLARRLTELHGGQLQIRSEPGRGTTVSVSLPIPKPETLRMA